MLTYGLSDPLNHPDEVMCISGSFSQESVFDRGMATPARCSRCRQSFVLRSWDSNHPFCPRCRSGAPSRPADWPSVDDLAVHYSSPTPLIGASSPLIGAVSPDDPSVSVIDPIFDGQIGSIYGTKVVTSAELREATNALGRAGGWGWRS